MIKSMLLIFLMFVKGIVLAHDARPVVVAINEQFPGVFQYSLTVPETVEPDNLPTVTWPEGCEEQSSVTGTGSRNGSVLCSRGLTGKFLTVVYPFFNPSLATFFRMTTLDGLARTAMLTPTQPQWQVPEEPTTGNVAKQYFALGVEHILGGLDHLLFVLGLLVIARTLKRILWTVTGFTVAHSITLSLSSLELVSIPIVPVEAAIALSIVFLAYEISREQHDSLTYQYPLIVSFGFGLLHGLGFASALGEIGLIQNEILVSLLFFNLGVEAGQIAFILLVTTTIWSLQKFLRHRSKVSKVSAVLTDQRMDLMAAYVIGIPAAYWLIDRVTVFLF
ncbi:MAG: HupE/UreJ family protein [Gammaproteobacteria bacterium]|nr:HupE/UreJ family protein [Gammaproteobacteria bacterium]